jgi:uncharacterized protein
MQKVFKTTENKTVAVIKHAQECLAKWPTTEIHIGTDSQNKRRYTTFCTVIAFRYGTRGVHYIYSKNSVKKIRNEITRLIMETEASVEVALWFRERLNVDLNIDIDTIQIDLDYNSDEQFLSNQVADGMAGWVTGSGFKANLKPNNQIATKAADAHCR